MLPIEYLPLDFKFELTRNCMLITAPRRLPPAPVARNFLRRSLRRVEAPHKGGADGEHNIVDGVRQDPTLVL